MNKTVLLLEQKLDEEFAYTGKTCSLEKWLLYFAWDFMSEITYDDNLGFLKTGGDVQDLIHQIDAGVTYFAVVRWEPTCTSASVSVIAQELTRRQIGQLPALDYLFDKNPIFPIKPSSLGSLLAWTAERMKLREEDSDRHSGAKHRAFIDFFLQLKRDVDWVDDGQVLAWLVINVSQYVQFLARFSIFYILANCNCICPKFAINELNCTSFLSQTNAGSDTTAIALAATFYLVLRHPRVHERLVSELRSASPPLPSPVPHTMTSSPSRLQYLNAVVLESTRLHPSLGLILERVVPPGAGLRLADGNVLPPGTIVGMNPHVVQRDKAIFGPDPEVFRPERWLRNEAETEGSWETRKKRMRDADLSFGAGNRACIGKELALMELKKTVATLFKDFDVSSLRSVLPTLSHTFSVLFL